jgi:triacylglycerol lipase
MEASVVAARVWPGAARWTSPRVLGGAAVECAWVATHVATYPLGLLRERARGHVGRVLRLDDLPPVSRSLLAGDVEAALRPVVLVHGMVDNRSVFTRLRRELLRKGFGHVESVSYSPLLGDVRTAARALAERVEVICAETHYDTVDLVGHSLGGVIGRYYVQRLGGDRRVRTLVTLGAPHAGTRTAHLLPHRLARQLRPGSALLAELDRRVPGCRSRFVAVWSDLDQMIVPQRNARIEHPDLDVRNVLVPSVGHLSLPIDGRVVHEVITALAERTAAAGPAAVAHTTA